MSTDFGKRLRQARKHGDLTQKTLGDAVGVSQGTISELESEGLSSSFVVQLATACNVSVHWLATGEGEMIGSAKPSSTSFGGKHVTALSDEDSLSGDYLQIRESEVYFSAGNGREPHYDEIETSVPATYRREWFVSQGIKPEQARRFKVSGDSMEPFLFDGDTVLVNLAESSILNGKVYAIRYGDELRIKRVYRTITGGLILHSDNPDYLPRDEEIAPSVVDEHISIIGRVRDKSGTGGL